MRATWILGLALVLGCGKELNPDYCTHHPDDSSCQVANETSLDASAGCTANSECPGQVCNTTSGACVQCSASDPSICTAMHEVCSVDTCVQCVTDTDCGSGSTCLPDSTCAAAGTILYAAPGGSGSNTSNDCTSAALPCSLSNAVGHASTAQNVVQLATGTYNEGTITLAVAGLQLVIAAQANVTITGSTGNNPLLAVTQSATISQITLDSSAADGIKCSNNATLVADQLVISNSGANAVNVDSCTLTLTRSKLIASKQSALTTSGTTVLTVLNNFMYLGGTGDFTGGGAVVLDDHTSGEVRFNTIGYNEALDEGPAQSPAGFSCLGETSATFRDNLVVSDTPFDAYTFEDCNVKTTDNWLGDGGKVNFVSTDHDAMDLHLTASTPNTSQGQNQAVRDNGNTSCAGVPTDFDNDLRPYNVACDYGADEFTPSDLQ
jgi:Cys-rich repeat protein